MLPSLTYNRTFTLVPRVSPSSALQGWSTLGKDSLVSELGIMFVTLGTSVYQHKESLTGVCHCFCQPLSELAWRRQSYGQPLNFLNQLFYLIENFSFTHLLNPVSIHYLNFHFLIVEDTVIPPKIWMPDT